MINPNIIIINEILFNIIHIYLIKYINNCAVKSNALQRIIKGDARPDVTQYRQYIMIYKYV